MARPRFDPSPKERLQVEAMSACGHPEADIARVIGISDPTLRKHFRAELDTGHIRANTKVAMNLFRIATGEGREAVAAAKFWLKTRARWSEAGHPGDAPKIVDTARAGAGNEIEMSWDDLLL